MEYKTDDQLRFLLENNSLGGLSSRMCKRHVKRGGRKKVYGDMRNIYGWSMLQYLTTGDLHESDFTKRNERNLYKTVLRTPDIKKYGCFIGTDLEKPANIHQKSQHLAFLPDKKQLK